MSSSSPLIMVVNHKAANIHSVDKALQRVGANAIVSSSADDLASASAAVLPGVGSSDAAMRALRKLDLIEPLKDFAASGRPLLGVCLGMQLLFDSSEEGDMPGLGLIPGVVKRMAPTADGASRKIPHMGWNTVRWTGEHPVTKGIPDGSYFYFVHSFYPVPTDDDVTLGETTYGLTFPSVVARVNIVATQFHPEKSGADGLACMPSLAS